MQQPRPPTPPRPPSIAKTESPPVDMEEVSPRSVDQKSERRIAQLAFKKAIRRGTCTLKELIDQFYVIEESYMISDYWEGIKVEWLKGCAMSKEEEKPDGVKPLNLRDFLKYAVSKKIKFKQHHIVDILRNDSENHDMSLKSFIKLLVLASCGGDRTKIGISNFKKLMNHMDIAK